MLFVAFIEIIEIIERKIFSGTIELSTGLAISLDNVTYNFSEQK